MTRVQMGNMGDDLDVFGSFYAVQVRSYVGEDGARQYSTPVRSNGVFLVNGSAPELRLEADVMGFSLGRGVRLTLV